MTDPKVFVGLPAYSRFLDIATMANISSAGMPVSYLVHVSSLLARCFNTLYCRAFNARKAFGYTHFCLMHADIEITTSDWLIEMLDEMKKTGVAVLSATVPIKQPNGDTSTALDIIEGKDDVTLLCMEDICKLPVTITPEICKRVFGNDKLLINTALMLIDMEKVDPERHYFHILDQIKLKNGEYFPAGCPEDWHFSRMLYADKLTYGATRRIAVKHWGFHYYANERPYGRKGMLN